MFGFLLLIVGIVGLVSGPAAIGDPGQIKDISNPLDPRLPWIYFGAAALFLLNGLVSHRAYLRDFYGESQATLTRRDSEEKPKTNA